MVPHLSACLSFRYTEYARASWIVRLNDTQDMAPDWYELWQIWGIVTGSHGARTFQL